MYRDTTVAYPDSKLVLGRYLGPSTDVGPAMTAKILKDNGQVVHRTTLRNLTEDEINSSEHSKLRAEYDARIMERLGESARPTDFPEFESSGDNYETLHYDL